MKSPLFTETSASLIISDDRSLALMPLKEFPVYSLLPKVERHFTFQLHIRAISGANLHSQQMRRLQFDCTLTKSINTQLVQCGDFGFFK